MIVVTAPTGQIGSKLVQQLLAQHGEVRVVVRDASRLAADVRERVQVVEGSHGDRATLDRALSGADAMFWLVPPNPAAPSTDEHYLAFAEAARDAIARGGGVGHVVGVSSAGHGWPKPAGVLSSAFAMDAELGRSGAAYRALSMPFYMENLLRQLDGILTRGTFSLTAAPDAPFATVATKDIAQTAADLLADLNWSGQENVPVFGPDRLTPDEMASVMSEELGRSVTYRRMSIEETVAMLRGAGASERTVLDNIDVATALDEGIYDADWSRARSTATDFRSWCREVLVPLAAERAAA
ncbi:NAD(P)H-binding protein [Rathayibacter sp. KR2-224]|uniref:NmrA family NAD(P)-binding protein n=1 Tax=Rathayibacter sp. KR2-224 TaxID=3400913 RepID=UPI003C0BF583